MATEPHPDDLSALATEEIIRRFEQAAIAYGVAASHYEEDEVPETDWQGEMDRLDRVKWALTRQVRRRGPVAEAAFLRLLRRADPYVRAESAMQAIHFAPAEAVPVLTDIAKRRGWIGWYARKVLNRYLAGADRTSSRPPGGL